MNNLLAIISDATKDDSSGWLIAASLPPLLYYLTKNKNLGWLHRLLLKRSLKRSQRKPKDDAATKILIVLIVGFFLVGSIIAFATGNSGAGWVALIIGIVLLGATMKRGNNSAHQY